MEPMGIDVGTLRDGVGTFSGLHTVDDMNPALL